MRQSCSPPSVFKPAPLSSGVLRLLAPSPAASPPAPNPRVQVFPSPNGITAIVGVTLAGEWVAEYRCLTSDFEERAIAAMERKVREKERRTIHAIR